MTTQYNVNIVGDLTNDNGILSGFSVNDYATLSETLEGLTINSLEIVFKFKTNSLTNNNAIFWTDKLIDTPSVAWSGLRLCNYNVDGWVFDLEITDNNTQLADIYDTTAILPNKYYYIKMLYHNTSGYKLYKSEDGENYTLVGTSAVTTMPSNLYALIGRAVNTDPMPLDGSIDLNESYIKVNGAMWWRGAESITKIQLRHDTAANWTSVNPVLLEGEVGIETDTRKQKIGDGSTAWNSLPYDAGSTALQSITSSDVTTALGYTPVNKAGDTMSGALTTTKLNISNMNQGAISLKNITSGGFSDVTFYNDNDNRIGFVRGNSVSATERNIQISACNDSGTPTSTFLLMCKNGINSCTFPNTTCCDGQWIVSSSNLASNVSLAIGTDQTLEYDLSSYLPNDSYKYEVLVSVDAQTGNSSGAGLTISLKGKGTSDGSNLWHRICNTYARGSWYMNIGNHAVVPIGTDRKLVLNYTVAGKAGTLNDIHVEGYRRIGTNS